MDLYLILDEILIGSRFMYVENFLFLVLVVVEICKFVFEIFDIGMIFWVVEVEGIVVVLGDVIFEKFYVFGMFDCGVFMIDCEFFYESEVDFVNGVLVVLWDVDCGEVVFFESIV